MIVVDRELADSERAALANAQVTDLAGRPPVAGPGPAERALWDWLENSGGLEINGVTFREFFRLGRSSYWLHVRARIFHTLVSHARALDRLGDREVLSRVSTVYCGNTDVDFWQWWAPKAETIVERPASLKRRISLLRVIADELLNVQRYLRSVRRALQARPPVVLFTKAQFNVPIDGRLLDGEFASLLEKCPEPCLRVEYHELPTVQLQARAPALRDAPRVHKTVESHAILASYLLRRPTAAPAFLKNWRKVKRRLRAPIEHDFGFPDPNGRWLELLRREIGRVGASVALLHLLEHAFEDFLSRLRPRVALVSGENNSPGRTFVDAARRLGITTAGIQHGDVTATNVDYVVTADEAKSSLPDYFLVWGERTRRFLVEQRYYDPERIVVTGHLRSDLLVAAAPDRASDSDYPSRRLLLFTSQPQPFLRNRLATARMLANFCKRHHLVCLLRLHPRELSGDIYEQSFSEAGIRHDLITSGEDLYTQIGRCDLGATCYSTTAWEMMRARKPVLLFDPFHMDLLGVRDEESVFHVDAGGDGFEAWFAERARHIERAEELARHFFGPGDGKAAERVIDLLEKIAGPICRAPSSAAAESSREP